MRGEDSSLAMQPEARTPGRACSPGQSGDSRDAGLLKIVYAAGMSPNDSSLYRLWALERLGHRVVALNAFDYRLKNMLLEKIVHRLAAGPTRFEGATSELQSPQSL